MRIPILHTAVTSWHCRAKSILECPVPGSDKANICICGIKCPVVSRQRVLRCFHSFPSVGGVRWTLHRRQCISNRLLTCRHLASCRVRYVGDRFEILGYSHRSEGRVSTRRALLPPPWASLSCRPKPQARLWAVVLGCFPPAWRLRSLVERSGGG